MWETNLRSEAEMLSQAGAGIPDSGERKGVDVRELGYS